MNSKKALFSAVFLIVDALCAQSPIFPSTPPLKTKIEGSEMTIQRAPEDRDRLITQQELDDAKKRAAAEAKPKEEQQARQERVEQELVVEKEKTADAVLKQQEETETKLIQEKKVLATQPILPRSTTPAVEAIDVPVDTPAAEPAVIESEVVVQPGVTEPAAPIVEESVVVSTDQPAIIEQPIVQEAFVAQTPVVEEKTEVIVTEPTTEQTPAVEQTSEQIEVKEQAIPTPPMEIKEEIPASEPKKEEPKAPEVPSDTPTLEDLVGIDTTGLEEPQGNWLYKRVWWERAEAKYDKIRNEVKNILTARMAFFNVRSAIDRDVLDPFYIKVGLKQNEIQTILSTLLTQIENQKKQQGVLEEKEREISKTLEAEQTTLSQILKDVEGIENLDHQVDDALSLLIEQINRVAQYDQQAWNYFREIARVLDDKKARELYYRIDNAARNINQIKDYINQGFAPSFNELSQKVKQKVEQVEQEFKTLSEKGINIKVQMEQLKSPKPAEKEEEIEEEKPQAGIVTRWIVNPIYSLFSAIGSGAKTIWDIVTYPITMWFYKAPVDQSEETAETEE